MDEKLNAVFLLISRFSSKINDISFCYKLKEIISDIFINKFYNKIPIINPYSSKKLIWDFFVTILTTMLFYIFSLRMVFYQNNIGDTFEIY